MSAWVVHHACLKEGEDMPCSVSAILTCKSVEGGFYLDLWWWGRKDEKKDDDQK